MIKNYLFRTSCICASARRDHSLQFKQSHRIYFYSRASARRDLIRPKMNLLIRHFYSRASARRDDIGNQLRYNITISTHAPLRGATWECVLTELFGQDFYSRASARRDPLVPFDGRHQRHISTHAPLRGATRIHHYRFRFHAISTHAPLRGATTVWCEKNGIKTISTHAPLRGATPRRSLYSSHVIFLLTRLCEARRKYAMHCDAEKNFYSRASARRDLLIR